MTSTIVEAVIQARMKANGKLIIHYPDHDWSGYPKDREQLDKWIDAANRHGLSWTLC